MESKISSTLQSLFAGIKWQHSLMKTPALVHESRIKTGHNFHITPIKHKPRHLQRKTNSVITSTNKANACSHSIPKKKTLRFGCSLQLMIIPCQYPAQHGTPLWTSSFHANPLSVHRWWSRVMNKRPCGKSISWLPTASEVISHQQRAIGFPKTESPKIANQPGSKH